MKTLFICSEEARFNHLGEEYDEILFVTNDIQVDNAQEWAFRIKDAVRSLASKVAVSDPDKTIKVVLDCPSPYHWMIANIKLEMSSNEEIKLLLPSAIALPDANRVIQDNNEITQKMIAAYEEQKERTDNAEVHGLRSDDGSEGLDEQDN